MGLSTWASTTANEFQCMPHSLRGSCFAPHDTRAAPEKKLGCELCGWGCVAGVERSEPPAAQRHSPSRSFPPASERKWSATEAYRSESALPSQRPFFPTAQSPTLSNQKSPPGLPSKSQITGRETTMSETLPGLPVSVPIYPVHNCREQEQRPHAQEQSGDRRGAGATKQTEEPEHGGQQAHKGEPAAEDDRIGPTALSHPCCCPTRQHTGQS